MSDRPGRDIDRAGRQRAALRIAWSKSSIRSSVSSRPTLTRTSPSVTPLVARSDSVRGPWVMDAGCCTRVSVPPRLTASVAGAATAPDCVEDDDVVGTALRGPPADGSVGPGVVRAHPRTAEPANRASALLAIIA